MAAVNEVQPNVVAVALFSVPDRIGAVVKEAIDITTIVAAEVDVEGDSAGKITINHSAIGTARSISDLGGQ